MDGCPTVLMFAYWICITAPHKNIKYIGMNASNEHACLVENLQPPLNLWDYFQFIKLKKKQKTTPTQCEYWLALYNQSKQYMCFQV